MIFINKVVCGAWVFSGKCIFCYTGSKPLSLISQAKISVFLRDGYTTIWRKRRREKIRGKNIYPSYEPNKHRRGSVSAGLQGTVCNTDQIAYSVAGARPKLPAPTIRSWLSSSGSSGNSLLEPARWAGERGTERHLFRADETSSVPTHNMPGIRNCSY